MRSQATLKAVLEGLPMAAILIRGGSWKKARVVHANQHYEQLFWGKIQAGQALPRALESLPLFLRDAETPLPLELHPLCLALLGQESTSQELQLRYPEENPRILLVRSSPVKERGVIVGATALVEDVTTRRRSQSCLAIQHEVARIVSEAEDLIGVAPRILEVMGRQLGWPYGALWAVEPDETLRFLSCWPETWGGGPLGVERLARAQGLPGRVFANRQPAWVSDFSQESSFPRAAAAGRQGLRTACAFPILLEGEVLGVLEFFSRDILQPEEQLVQSIAAVGCQLGQFIKRRRDEASLRQARRQAEEAYRREHDIASRFQSALLPCRALSLPGYSVAFTHRAALPEADVGGDFFNLFELGQGRVCLVLGDVAGKGLRAAVVAAWFQHALMALALRPQATPAGVLDDAQRFLESLEVEGLVTVFFAVLEPDTGRLDYSSAGHEPALVWRESERRVEWLKSGQPALVGLPVGPHRDEGTTLYPGDALLVYTDGLPEAGMKRGDGLGEEGVAGLLAAHHGSQPADILQFLCTAAAQRGPHDDIAMAALRRCIEPAHPSTFSMATCHCQDSVCRPEVGAHEPRNEARRKQDDI